MRGFTATVVAMCVLWMIGAGAARAEDADALFAEGKQLAADGRYAEACDRFARSLALEPSLNVTMNLADCREKDRKLHAAFVLFEQVARESTDALAAEAQRRAAALAPRLSTLTVRVPPGHAVAGLVVTVDDQPLAADQWNVARPIDGGIHRVTALAPGLPSWTATVSVAIESARAAIAVPRLDGPPAVPEVGGADPGDPTVTSPPAPPAPRDRGMPTMRKLAIGVSVTAVLALGAGGYLGISANGFQDDADMRCPGEVCRDPQALELNQDARNSARDANLAFVTSGVLAAGAVSLWIFGGRF